MPLLENCDIMAEHFHIFWYCHLLQKYWEDILRHKKIFSVEIPKDPVQFTLGVPPETLIHKDQRYILHFILLLEWKTITANCRKPFPPTKRE